MLARLHQAAATAIWTDGAHAPVVGRILDLMGSAITPAAVGGPAAVAIEDLVKRLDCQRYDDLRKLLVEQPVAYVLFAAPAEPADTELLQLHLGKAQILSLEPLVLTLAANQASRPPTRVLQLPSFLRSSGWLKAANPLEAIGPAQSLALLSVNRPGDCSLLALLFDAWQFLLAVVGSMPDSVDASLSPKASRPAESLSTLSGHLTAHARLSDGRGAVLQVSDQGPDCRRSLQLMGTSGLLRAGDLDYQLLGADGRTIDQHHARQRHLTFADLVADQWHDLLQGRSSDAEQPEARQVLACCQACLLSIRTRSPENPHKLVGLSHY